MARAMHCDIMLGLCRKKSYVRILGLFVLVCFTFLVIMYNSRENKGKKGRKFSDHQETLYFGKLKNSSSFWPLSTFEEVLPEMSGHAANNGDTCYLARSHRADADIHLNDIMHNWSSYSEKADDVNLDEQLLVFVVPFSHSDPGWLSTLDEYYNEKTGATLSNMLTKLTTYKDMTFLWTETVFLAKWWDQLESNEREQVKKLLEEGLEIAGGGWVMVDEANVHYQAIIDQYIEGHQWLLENVDVRPQVNWAIDPFGHSSTLPYLLKHVGFETMLIQRVHYMLKDILARSKNLEFAWRQSWDPSGREDMPCHLISSKSYAIWAQCGPDRQVCSEFDFRRVDGVYTESRSVPIYEDNIRSKSVKLLQQYQAKAQDFRSNVLLVLLGDDFRYNLGKEWDQQYENYKKLFDYINKQKEWNVKAQFGTLSNYFDAVKMRMKNKAEHFPVVEGDFFPYSDVGYDMWTGYFTTRPFSKEFGRFVEARLRAADILFSITLARLETISETAALHVKNDFNDELVLAHQMVGLFQHHDAITGTSRPKVVKDYLIKLLAALKTADAILIQSFLMLCNSNFNERIYHQTMPDINKFRVDNYRENFDSVPEKNVIVLQESQKKGKTIYVYNPLPYQRKTLITLHISNPYVVVIDSNGQPSRDSQVNPVWETQTVISQSRFELVVYVLVPALGITHFEIWLAKHVREARPVDLAVFTGMPFARPSPHFKIVLVPPQINLPIILENDYISAEFSRRNGTLQRVTLKKENSRVVHAEIQMMYYYSRRSGAYLFAPYNTANFLQEQKNPIMRLVMGPVMSQMHVIYGNTVKSPLLTHIVTIHHKESDEAKTLQIQNLVDVRERVDVELIMRISTDIDSKRFFHTDLNGFQMVRRQSTPSEGAEANYYPVTNMAAIEGTQVRMTLHMAQAHGVGSLAPGQLEVMLDRMLARDDFRGLGHGVLDVRKVHERFVLQFEVRKAPAATVSDKMLYPSVAGHLSNAYLNHPAIVFVPTTVNDQLANSYSKENLQLISKPISCDIHMVNFRPILAYHPSSINHVTVRSALILHKLGIDCAYDNRKLCESDNNFSLASLFPETMLSGVVEQSLSLMYKKSEISINSDLKLKPMQIYVYNLTFSQA